jgi:hypothetical protein
MRALASCDGVLSGEHLVTEAVMQLLAGDGDFTIGGTPWLAPGEFRSVGPKSLTAKCLCRRHNSALHLLDDAALFLFKALRQVFEDDINPAQAVVSGHDVERWLLKTLKAMAVSRNLARGQDPLAGHFAAGVDVLALLDDVQAWPSGAGLYCTMQPGDLTQNHNRFQLAPLTNGNNEISGLWTNILGLSFILALAPLDLRFSPQIAGAVYRPGAVMVSHPTTQSIVHLSWADGRRHADTMALEFVTPVGESA